MQSKLPSNPFVSYTQSERHQYLEEISGSKFVVSESNKATGVKYADSLIVYTRWEVYSFVEDAPKSVLRHSWNIKWLNKPYLVSSLIYNVAKKKIENNVR